MNKALCPLCALFLAASAVLGAPAYYVVTTTDMLGNRNYEVCEKEEMQARKNQAASEARCFQKAVDKLKKEWEAPENKETHQFGWQGQKLRPRTVRESPPFPTSEKAAARADALTAREFGSDAKKPKKKLSKKEAEKLDRKRMRQAELEQLAQAVQKEIEAMMAAAPTTAAK